MKQPKEITTCYLECLLMPNGEIISLGKTIGWFKEYQKHRRIRSDWKQLCVKCHDELDKIKSCKHGHEYTKENTYIRPDGNRDCRTCMRRRDAK